MRGGEIDKQDASLSSMIVGFLCYCQTSPLSCRLFWGFLPTVVSQTFLVLQVDSLTLPLPWIKGTRIHVTVKVTAIP